MNTEETGSLDSIVPKVEHDVSIKEVINVENIIAKTDSSENCYDSIMKYIDEKKNDQDFQQQVNVFLTLLLEIYRVLMGALLMVFIPQKCGEDICTLSDNINRDNDLSKAAFAYNIITLVSFLGLYVIEVKRENKMINYLEVNRFKSVDNESVGEALIKLPSVKKDKILTYDKYYLIAGNISTINFTINTILSTIVVINHYFDSKTITVLLTNVLFMGSKVMDVRSTVNTPINVFYSAYLKDKIQYNDVDPDKLIQAESSNTSDDNSNEGNSDKSEGSKESKTELLTPESEV